MWIGRRPASVAPTENPAATEAFAAALTGACAELGCAVDEYVAAAGPYGSWLVKFTRDGCRFRLVWNGREGRLVLEEASGRADWSERRAQNLEGRDLAAFLAALATILDRGDEHRL